MPLPHKPRWEDLSALTIGFSCLPDEHVAPAMPHNEMARCIVAAKGPAENQLVPAIRDHRSECDLRGSLPVAAALRGMASFTALVTCDWDGVVREISTQSVGSTQHRNGIDPQLLQVVCTKGRKRKAAKVTLDTNGETVLPSLLLGACLRA